MPPIVPILPKFPIAPMPPISPILVCEKAAGSGVTQPLGYSVGGLFIAGGQGGGGR